ASGPVVGGAGGRNRPTGRNCAANREANNPGAALKLISKKRAGCSRFRSGKLNSLSPGRCATVGNSTRNQAKIWKLRFLRMLLIELVAEGRIELPTYGL